MKGFAKWRTVTVLHELLILTSKTPENSQITTKARDTKEAGYKNRLSASGLSLGHI